MGSKDSFSPEENVTYCSGESLPRSHQAEGYYQFACWTQQAAPPKPKTFEEDRRIIGRLQVLGGTFPVI
jgi:hypothetical protein